MTTQTEDEQRCTDPAELRQGAERKRARAGAGAAGAEP